MDFQSKLHKEDVLRYLCLLKIIFSDFFYLGIYFFGDLGVKLTLKMTLTQQIKAIV